jgi:UDP-sugar transporter A1/2/3
MAEKEHFFGIQLKWVSLATLVIQNSSLALVMHYSQTIPGPKYNAATAVVCAEILKLILSLVIHIKTEEKKRCMTLNSLYDDVFGPESNWVQMTVPATLYFVQNNLLYTAAKSLDAATYQVSSQFKIITTAIFTVMLLHRSIAFKKWVALIILSIGIATVNISKKNESKSTHGSFGDQFIGLTSIIIAGILSGLAGVW